MRTVQYCTSKSAKCNRMRLTKFTRFCGFRKNSHALHIRIRYVPSRNVSICRIRLRDTKLCYVSVFSSFVRWRTNNCSCTSTRWSRGMFSVMSSKLIQLSIIKLPGSLSKGKDRQSETTCGVWYGNSFLYILKISLDFGVTLCTVNTLFVPFWSLAYRHSP